MKKLLFLVLPLAFALYSCNSNNQPNTDAAPADSTAVQTDAAAAPSGPTDSMATSVKSDGTSTMPAQVFEESSGKPVDGAKVDALENSRSVASATTNIKGDYSYNNLIVGRTYTYRVTKEGYGTVEKSAVYDGTNSLPPFGLTPTKK